MCETRRPRPGPPDLWLIAGGLPVPPDDDMTSPLEPDSAVSADVLPAGGVADGGDARGLALCPYCRVPSVLSLLCLLCAHAYCSVPCRWYDSEKGRHMHVSADGGKSAQYGAPPRPRLSVERSH
jgi:hypothetical protein